MPSPKEVIEGALVHAYDPQKRHQYYLRNRQLQGRTRNVPSLAVGHPTKRSMPSAQRSVGFVPPQPTKKAVAPNRIDVAARLSSLQSRLELLKRVLSTRERPAPSGSDSNNK